MERKPIQMVLASMNSEEFLGPNIRAILLDYDDGSHFFEADMLKDLLNEHGLLVIQSTKTEQVTLIAPHDKPTNMEEISGTLMDFGINIVATNFGWVPHGEKIQTS